MVGGSPAALRWNPSALPHTRGARAAEKQEVTPSEKVKEETSGGTRGDAGEHQHQKSSTDYSLTVIIICGFVPPASLISLVHLGSNIL